MEIDIGIGKVVAYIPYSAVLLSRTKANSYYKVRAYI